MVASLTSINIVPTAENVLKWDAKSEENAKKRVFGSSGNRAPEEKCQSIKTKGIMQQRAEKGMRARKILDKGKGRVVSEGPA
jgi:hypothetical protein